MREAISAAIIEGNRILLVRKKDTWILPGGKPEEGEGHLECLCREVREELSETELSGFVKYGEFSGQTPYRRDELNAVVYFANIDGKLKEPAAEIADAKWMSFSMTNYCKLSDISSKIVNALQEDGYF